MKRIIIFHISKIGGHRKAAQNIKEALRNRQAGLDIKNIDGLSYFYPAGGKIIDYLYTTAIKHLPNLWGRIYDRKKVVKNLKPFRKIVNRKAFKKLSQLTKKFPPDCFVATQAFPCGIVADFKEKFNRNIPLIAVVTDYHPHRFWIHPAVNRYVVACEDAKEVLLREGVEEEKIKILGIPICVDFLNSYPKNETAQRFGFIRNLNSVLLMGGGLGIGPIKMITRQLDQLDAAFQLIVICGRNRKLYRWFRRKARSFKKPIFYFGYIDFVNQIMDFSDIIITKAGGVTISEALAKGLTIIIAHPLPGQEERNVDYLLKSEAIVKVDEIAKMGGVVTELLSDKKKIYSLKERARKISFIDSGLRVADLILKEISE